jgi:predicted O-methyltransferase YrrM
MEGKFSMTWSEHDGTAAEREMAQLIGSFIEMLKPELVVETGAYLGWTANEIGWALLANRRGKLITCETNSNYAKEARVRCSEALAEVVEVREINSLELPELATADFVFLDSSYDLRPLEYDKVKRGATVVVHDTGDAAQQYSTDPERKFHLGKWCREQGMIVWPHAGRGFAIGVKP